MNKHEDFMMKALTLAKKAAEVGEVPVGALIVRRDTGEILGEGFNMRENNRNPVAHAEIIAIENAAKALGSWRLSGCSIYVTLEPCPMCCGAIINSRISHVYFGSFDLKAGSVCSVQEMFSLPYNHSPQWSGGILQKECTDILSEFFNNLRNKKS